MIYAIRAVGTEYIKFGKADSVGKRLKELETASPYELNIEAVANWPNEEERRIHRYLMSSYVRGEWFTVSERAAEVIRLFQDTTLGLERWRAICKRYQVKTPTDLREQKARLPKKPVRLQLPTLNNSQPTESKSLMTPSPDMVRASQFMQSLMDLESTTLLSIANSLSTERQTGVMQRSVEPS